MPGKQRSKLLQTRSDWPDLRRNYRDLAIPAVRAAVMAQSESATSRSSDAEDHAERRGEPSPKHRRAGQPRSST
jgi:hypothetical protein